MTPALAPPLPALVLAAGMGTRLRGVAGDVPKPLVEVAGIPVIERVLRWLAAEGVERTAVNLHHQADLVRGHLAQRAGAPRLTFSQEPELLGTAGAMGPLANFLGDRFVVVYGDVLTDLSLRDLVSFHDATRAELSMALYHVPNPTQCGIVALDETCRVTRLVEKPAPDAVFSDLANAGILVVEGSVQRHVPAGRPVDFGHHVIPALLSEGARVFGWPVPEGTTVFDMGTPAGLQRAEDWLHGDHAPAPPVGT